MFQYKIPPEINYETILPKGFPSIFKQWRLDPMTNNKQWANNDIVRFLFMNTSKGVFDPYKSYIQIVVSCNLSTNPVGLLQIDNSAQSFIQQTVLYSNNKQIQRINNYSILAAYLNDIGLNEMISEGRQSQGLGYGSFDTMPFTKGTGSNGFASRGGIPATGTTCTFPTIGNYLGDTSGTLANQSLLNASKSTKGHVSNSNLLTTKDNNMGEMNPNIPGYQASINTIGYAHNIRSQYHTKFTENNYPQTTQSIPNYELCLASSVSNGVYPFNFSPQNPVPYQTSVRSTLTTVLFYDTTNNTNTHTVNTSNFGFTSLFTPFFTRGTFEPVISPTVPQCSLNNGMFLQSKIPITQRTFKIPLISAVIGVLVDPSQYKLIPMQSINTALLQITLDPFAMFTSGYNDMCEVDNVGMGLMQSRNYQIQKIQYKLQTYNFVDEQIQKFIEISLTKEISIITNFWSMSNQYQIPGGTGPNNTYIVGCSASHLNQLVCLFVPNDYQTYTFCRKHFRISNNITKFWAKLGVDYWPPQPWKGNGGNVVSNNQDDDNSSYMQNVYWSGNYLFSKAPLPRINPYNFALNDRVYNVTNTNTLYNPDMLWNQNYAFTSSSVNADTAMGMAWIHENRAVGKAAYVLSFTPFCDNEHILQGINVQGLSNFEVIFQNSQTNVFQRDQTLYIFAKSSGIVKYTPKQIFTYGRG